MLAQPQPLSYEQKTFMDKIKHHFVIFFTEMEVLAGFLSSNYGTLGPLGLTGAVEELKAQFLS